ncbi:hypothetical protein EHI8A_065620 [Entamoeba histolytica HM-1:IMSS-B]|uniref:DNA2/NAM7 helicase helicase domain-containing protein n=2 Tax=Entamoeba histolytica (strain ATCC 30459 / HM-1:IMSS / ABRM) TaxID=294381 RepID=C4M7L4_ENTH1|nr:hypothetical protein, conserved [Entamoeba histolytica HM-1:IMSS]EAL50020.2 hypothetical protein, conserved [Entamoeba histolytica HM-1:IMSS]EMH72429.1 hypothetical protein EHI8A_065620 [Entamoeba histolytica HM-1:IMSS-B]|eukprot:XP_655406.2 hypothetical protein, conserved [Entamoeba histolytica HM-1:IMSS]
MASQLIKNLMNFITTITDTEKVQNEIQKNLPLITIELCQRDTHHKTKELLRNTHLLERINIYLESHPNDINLLLLSNAYHFKRYPITPSFITIERNDLQEIYYKRLRFLQVKLFNTSLKSYSKLPLKEFRNKLKEIEKHIDIIKDILVLLKLIDEQEDMNNELMIKIFEEYFINEMKVNILVSNDESLYPDEEWFQKEEYPQESLPILTPSYLDEFDYLLRNSILFRKETFDSASDDIMTEINELGLSTTKNGIRIKKYGKHTLPLIEFHGIEVDEETIIGNNKEIKCSFEINLNDASDETIQWSPFKKEIIFLVELDNDGQVKRIRGGEILEIKDKDNKTKGFQGTFRRIEIQMERKKYQEDKQENKHTFHVMIWRNKDVGTFKRVLENVHQIIQQKKFEGINEEVKNELLGICHKELIKKEDKIKLKQDKHEEVICSVLNEGIHLIKGKKGTRKTYIAMKIVEKLVQTKKKVLIVSHSNQTINTIIKGIIESGVKDGIILRLGHGKKELKEMTQIDFSKKGRVEKALLERMRILEELQKIAILCNIPVQNVQSCEMGLQFIQMVKKHKESGLSEAQIDEYENKIKMLIPLEILRAQKQKEKYIELSYCQIIGVTSTYVTMNFDELKQHFDYVIVDEASQMLELELGLLILKIGLNGTKTLILIGNEEETPVVIHNKEISEYTKLNEGLFQRWAKQNQTFELISED